MPEAIVYCDRCGRLIPPSEHARALIGSEISICAACAQSLSADERAKVAGAGAASQPLGGDVPRKKSSRRMHVASRTPPPAEPQARPVVASLLVRYRRHLPWIIVSLVGALGGFLLTIALVSRRAPRPPAVTLARPDSSVAGAVPPPVASPIFPALPPVPPPVAPASAPNAASDAAGLARVATIRGWVDPMLGRYAAIRETLQEILAGNPQPAVAEAARALMAEVDAEYAKLAEEALAVALKAGRELAASGEMGVAVSGIKSIAPRYCDGPWLDAVGKQQIQAALEELEGVRVTNLDREDPGAGIPPDRDMFVRAVSDAGEYRLMYDLNLCKLGGRPRYFVDNSAAPGEFRRIAYFVELWNDVNADPEYVFVAMDAFTNDATRIGVPAYGTGAVFQMSVANMTVITNVPSVLAGTGLQGNIEFWPGNYAAQNAANVPGASNSVFDFGDQQSQPENGYGSMQVHNTPAGQTLFAINQWRSGRDADIGLGNSPSGNPDWTFSRAASKHPRMRLRVFVR